MARQSVEDDLLKNKRPKTLSQCFDQLGVPDEIFTRNDQEHGGYRVKLAGDEEIILQYNVGADWVSIPLMSELYAVIVIRVGIDQKMQVTRMEHVDLQFG